MADLRAHGGRATSGPFAGRELLILKTDGAKTGKQSENPLAFSEDGDMYVVVASKGGAPSNPAWYHNLLANPDAGVEVGPETRDVNAVVTSGEERERLFRRQSEHFPQFADYEQKTTREIPVVALE